MKRLLCLLLLQLPINAQLTEIDLEVQKDWDRQSRMTVHTQFPQPIKPFELYESDIPKTIIKFPFFICFISLFTATKRPIWNTICWIISSSKR